jgi:hypothetical protein
MMNISLLEIMKEFVDSRLDAGQYGSLRTDAFVAKPAVSWGGTSGVSEV